MRRKQKICLLREDLGRIKQFWKCCSKTGEVIVFFSNLVNSNITGQGEKSKSFLNTNFWGLPLWRFLRMDWTNKTEVFLLSLNKWGTSLPQQIRFPQGTFRFMATWLWWVIRDVSLIMETHLNSKLFYVELPCSNFQELKRWSEISSDFRRAWALPLPFR